ncbi:phage/plasmid primase, P4 family [Sphingomonas sp.]|jgi:putative DNA primase/helicase|uniref:phage/plasmid primase, P4 family n=1 Tax=Sphingomonas sp. TaxID=28214 RepID=UPI002ED86439
MSAAAADYAEQGIAVLPLRPRSKVPATSHGKKDATSDREQVAAWFTPDTNRNIGILTGERSRLLVLDIDPRNGGDASFERFERTYGKLPATKRAITGGGGFHLFFRLPEGATGLSDRPNVADFKGLDVKCDGYVVAAPSVHPDTGKAYAWEADVPIADAPAHLIELARGGKRIKSAAVPSSGAVEEGGRNDTLFRMASGLRARGLSPEAIIAAVQAENTARCAPPLDADEVERIVQSAMRYDPGSDHAETELGNARRLVDALDGNARFEPASRHWFCWDGQHWARDDEGHITRQAKRVVDGLLTAAKLVNDPDTSKRRMAFAFKSQTAARISGMIELAKTEPGVPIKFDAFDRQPHLLNVANGMVDLRTGELLPHDRDAFATHVIDIEYDPAAPCPVFETFIADVLAHDPELVEYVQRAVGYAATGETREQCFFVLHGEGANGKSTALNAMRSVLGSYGKHTPTDTLTVKSGGASNDLARLAGTRFVTASEANADQRLADALLKQVTGDEPIVARFLFKEFISFRPTFKLFLATNQLPQVNGNDPAIWRRIRTIPFTRVFTPEEQDRQLADKLAAEQAGILAWIIRGAVDWYKHGLPTPVAVAAANAEYRADMDSVGQFIDERCELAADAAVSAQTLYGSYRHHSNDNGRSPVSTTMFGRTLSKRGFLPDKRGGVQYRVGLQLRTTL